MEKIERDIYSGNGVNHIYLALKESHAFFFNHDDNIDKIRGFSSDPEITVPEDNLDKYFDETQADWVFVDCFKKAETKLAFIPGIGSLVLVNYLGQSVIIHSVRFSIPNDKYFCSRGLIIFNDCL